MKKVTIIGSTGFIGGELKSYLDEIEDIELYTPSRPELDQMDENLGVVVYCAGFGDCNKPKSVIDANINGLMKLLITSSYEKLIYLSSTRVYMESYSSHENSDVTVLDKDDRRLFNLSKLVAEELCLKSPGRNIILRPSNVYGKAIKSNLFLPSIVRNAVIDREINMYISREYQKDYVSVNDVVSVIYNIIINECKYDTYNIASGKNTKAITIADIISSKTKCSVNWLNKIKDESFPETNIDRIIEEFNFSPSNVIDDLEIMVDIFDEEFRS
ncbi:NAD-dependent epimerase/dehydratase family protein [Vibrio splendidus]